MPLSPEQRSAVEAEAKKRNVDPDKLIAAVEGEIGGGNPNAPAENGQPATEAEKPKLFMYLLPFVTVREVRQNWLGLTDSFAGDSEVASKWAAKQGGVSRAPAAADEL